MSSIASPAQQKQCTLLALPAELRVKIYEYIVDETKTPDFKIRDKVHVYKRSVAPDSAILRLFLVCRTVYVEAVGVLKERRHARVVVIGAGKVVAYGAAPDMSLRHLGALDFGTLEEAGLLRSIRRVHLTVNITNKGGNVSDFKRLCDIIDVFDAAEGLRIEHILLYLQQGEEDAVKIVTKLLRGLRHRTVPQVKITFGKGAEKAIGDHGAQAFLKDMDGYVPIYSAGLE